MKKILVIIIVLFSVSIMGENQEYLKKEAKIDKLKGNIKTISLYEQYSRDNKLLIDKCCGKMTY